MYRLRYPILIALLLWALILCLGLTRPSANATDNEKIMKDLLQRFQDPTAEYVGITKSQVTGKEFLLFHSDETERDYRFDKNGMLCAIFSTSSEEPVRDGSELSPDEEAQLQKSMTEFAETCISSYQIGTVEMVSNSHFSGSYVYEFREVYQGIPTGSRIALECGQDGQVFYAMVTKGEVFETERRSRHAPEIGISEEQAIEAAVQAVSEKIAGTDSQITDDAKECRLDASGADLYYTVQVTTRSGQEAYPITYWGKVNVTDGTVMDLVFTQ